MKLSLVVPCYNEQDNIEAFCKRSFAVLREKIDDYEIVFVNDGSVDNTWVRMKNAAKSGQMNIKLINFSRNFGKEAAMYAGLKRACGDYVAIIDADLQQDPAIVLEMVDYLEQNPDFDSVCACQKERREGRFISFCKNTFYKIINRTCRVDFRSGASDFRTFRREMVNAILKLEERSRFSKGIFSWVGFNTHYIEYKADKRNAGKSSWSFFKLMRYAKDGFISFTAFPLKIATMVGLISAVASLIYMIAVIIQKLCFGISVPGYATIVVLLLFLGGVQLITFGIMGEYIAQIYTEAKGRPLYIEKEYYEKHQESDKD